jgi:hypothetical protein
MTERGGLAAQVAVKVLSAIESDVADLTHQERTEAASLLRRWLESTGKTLEARLRQRLQALDGSVETDTRVASERQAIQAALDTFLELRRSYCGTAPGVRP